MKNFHAFAVGLQALLTDTACPRNCSGPRTPSCACAPAAPDLEAIKVRKASPNVLEARGRVGLHLAGELSTHQLYFVTVFKALKMDKGQQRQKNQIQ